MITPPCGIQFNNISFANNSGPIRLSLSCFFTCEENDTSNQKLRTDFLHVWWKPFTFNWRQTGGGFLFRLRICLQKPRFKTWIKQIYSDKRFYRILYNKNTNTSKADQMPMEFFAGAVIHVGFFTILLILRLNQSPPTYVQAPKWSFSSRHVDLRFWQLSPTIQSITQYPSWW